jgi:phosphatidylserine/phosphatidylglycerophosphate/cardiolipin synthase-like enzyme
MRTGPLSFTLLALLVFPLGCGSKASDVHTDAGNGADSSAEAGQPLQDGATPTPDGGRGADGAGPGTDGSSGTDTGAPLNSGITITVEPDGSKDAAALLNAIKGAETAVHVEVYLLTNTTYIQAFIDLANAGKDVKVILNQTFPSGTSMSDTNAYAYSKLNGTKVDVHWAPTTTGFDSYTHEKTVIIDPAGGSDSQVWIMTMNLDTAGPVYNREFLAEDTNAPDIAEAEAIFEADFASKDITPSGSLVVAPSPQNNAVSSLVSLINSATTSIDMEAEEFDDSGDDTEELVFNALAAKAKAGVAVHLVLEDSSYSSQTSAVAELQKAGGKVVGYSCSGNGLDIHAKALVADGARAYIGSENFSGGSLGYNRELGVIFSEPSAVSKVFTTITADFAGGSTYSSTCSF